MACVNKVTLIGHVGKDPEIRSLQNGGQVATFSLATSETWKDRGTGEKREKTEWHRIVIWNEGLIGVVERFVKKGSKLYLEGALETRKWTDQVGVERYVTEIALKAFRGELVLLDAARTGGAPPPPEGAGGPAGSSSRTLSGRPKPVATGHGDLPDDDIPF